MTKHVPITLDSFAEFVWGFDHEFLLTVKDEDGNASHYVWSDPDYNGDNTIRPYKDDPMDFTHKGFSGRWKGSHFVRNYCGENVVILEN